MKRLFALLMVLSFLATTSLVMAQGTVASSTPANSSSTPVKKKISHKIKHGKKKMGKKKMAPVSTPSATEKK